MMADRSTAAERHQRVMGRPPITCACCGQDTRPEDAQRDLRLAVLRGDQETQQRLTMRLTAAGIDPADIIAAARKEAADDA